MPAKPILPADIAPTVKASTVGIIGKDNIPAGTDLDNIPAAALDDSGNVKEDIQEVVAKDVFGSGFRVTETLLLPVFQATIDAPTGVEDIAAVSFIFKGKELLANRISGIRLVKILPGSTPDAPITGGRFEYEPVPAAVTDGKFSLQPETGGAFLPANHVLEDEVNYLLTLYIKDGGPFDLDNIPSTVTDPAMLVNGSGGGGGGGCSASFAPLLGILALAGIAAIGRKRV